MTFFAAIAVLFLAASTLLVFAGREFLRVNEYPPHRVHDIGGPRAPGLARLRST